MAAIVSIATLTNRTSRVRLRARVIRIWPAQQAGAQPFGKNFVLVDEEVDDLRKHMNACGLTHKIVLVVVSPLLSLIGLIIRDYGTMQTTTGVFGGHSISTSQVEEKNPLMVENTGNSCCQAISSSESPPFIAIEYCRERMGKNPCDKRRSITEYSALFPGIDFSQIENDEYVYWKPHSRETDEQVAARGVTFLKCFSNRELRSMVLIDTSMLGSDVPITNYPGGTRR